MAGGTDMRWGRNRTREIRAFGRLLFIVFLACATAGCSIRRNSFASTSEGVSSADSGRGGKSATHGNVGGAGGVEVTGDETDLESDSDAEVDTVPGDSASGAIASGGGAGGAGKAGTGAPRGGAGGHSGTAGGTGETEALPGAGNPDGHCETPADARADDTSIPTEIVGTGVPESCTSDAFVNAVAKGGVVTFNCGPNAVTVTLDRTAKVFNDKSPKIVIDGGNKVTLSGGKKVRILYQNTCDEHQVWTTSHCDDQDHPQLTVQNITLIDGNAEGEPGGLNGGGAIFARGGRLKVVNSRFFNHECDDTGPDVGGAAIRAFDQYGDQPVYIVKSTFGGAKELGNICSNGGAISSIGVSYTVINSLLSYNKAIGYGGKPGRTGTPGGGNGGAIYNDGDTFTLTLCGTEISHNTATENGGAIFFMSNDRSGSLVIKDSILTDNGNNGQTEGYPGIFAQSSATPNVINSTIE
jgi:hypothetical protein